MPCFSLMLGPQSMLPSHFKPGYLRNMFLSLFHKVSQFHWIRESNIILIFYLLQVQRSDGISEVKCSWGQGRRNAWGERLLFMAQCHNVSQLSQDSCHLLLYLIYESKSLADWVAQIVSSPSGFVLPELRWASKGCPPRCLSEARGVSSFIFHLLKYGSWF